MILVKELKSWGYYHQVGLGIDDPPTFKSLSTSIKDLGHEGRMIDIFKTFAIYKIFGVGWELVCFWPWWVWMGMSV